MRHLLAICLAASLFSGCDNSTAEQAKLYARDAALAQPCVVALEDSLNKKAGPDYRGFRFADARPTELAANHYVIDVAYVVVTLTDPSGQWPSHALCELRDGVVVTLRHP